MSIKNLKVGRSLTKFTSAKCLTLFGIAALAPLSANAQKLGSPGGWSVYGWATDNFNDTSLGWQWNNTHNFYNWENSTRKNGNKTWTRFRTQNVQMTGQHCRIINWYHSSPITEWNPKIGANAAFDYSGGVLGSKANWLTEGQFQCYSKVQWNFADIWPTFWTDKGGADELDIMEYQSDILNHSHHDKNKPQATRSSKRVWAPWMANKWEHDWAMARVRSWTHWAARTTRNTQATFYINGKKEHTSQWHRVDTSMEMLFTSSPHFHHLPGPGSYPDYRIDWVETHIP